MFKSFLLTCFLSVQLCLFAQEDTLRFFENAPQPHSGRITLISAGSGGLLVGSTLALNQLWYADYPRSDFHFFDDNAQWMQMDKAGHVFSSYQLGRVGYQLMQWSGINDKKSAWYGGNLGLLFLTTVEVMDGFSEEWGFSTGDYISNVAGTGVFIAQQLLWEEQRISLKFSASSSPYAGYRPQVLGNTPAERLFKDYNGQTYWASVNLRSFFQKAEFIPSWLNLAVGYSVNQMLGGSENPLYNNSGDLLPSIKPYRQYLLSLDVDLYKINTNKPWLNSVLRTFGFLKFPFPALEFSEGKLKGHLLYY